MTENLLKKIAKSQLDSDFYSGLEKADLELENELDRICITDDLKRAVMSGGKRMRPNLAYTAYRLGSSDTEIVPLMVMVELMHSASLIHDDVVDKAGIRRNVPTINATSGDYRAVQSADYLLSRAMEYLHVYRGSGIDERLAEVSLGMCRGEFLEIREAFRISEDAEEKYFELIRHKTAIFIGACAACGGIAGGLPAEYVKSLEDYGTYLGIAFQIRDDCLDYEGEAVFGKKIGQDLDSGLYTLPLIYAMKAEPLLYSLLKTRNPNGSLSQKDSEYVIKKVCRYGINDCRRLVEEYSTMAVEAIKDIPSSPAKDALILMAEGLKNRKK